MSEWVSQWGQWVYSILIILNIKIYQVYWTVVVIGLKQISGQSNLYWGRKLEKFKNPIFLTGTDRGCVVRWLNRGDFDKCTPRAVHVKSTSCEPGKRAHTKSLKGRYQIWDTNLYGRPLESDGMKGGTHGGEERVVAYLITEFYTGLSTPFGNDFPLNQRFLI